MNNLTNMLELRDKMAPILSQIGGDGDRLAQILVATVYDQASEMIRHFLPGTTDQGYWSNAAGILSGLSEDFMLLNYGPEEQTGELR